MMTLRPRMTVVALMLAAAGLSACAAGPTAPVDLDTRDKVSADVDTTKRGPTTPWTSVQSTTPAIPWN